MSNAIESQGDYSVIIGTIDLSNGIVSITPDDIEVSVDSVSLTGNVNLPKNQSAVRQVITIVYDYSRMDRDSYNTVKQLKGTLFDMAIIDNLNGYKELYSQTVLLSFNSGSYEDGTPRRVTLKFSANQGVSTS